MEKVFFYIEHSDSIHFLKNFTESFVGLLVDLVRKEIALYNL